MKKIILYGILLFSYSFLGIFLLYKKEWLFLSFFLLLALGNGYLNKKRNEEYMAELKKISESLEMVLQKKKISYQPDYTDLFEDRILFQIYRINEVNLGYQAELEKEQESMKQLLAEIAHQLRTPLANMETYFALLEDKEIPKEELHSYLQAVKSSEEKIKFLVENFILAARMEKHIIQIHKMCKNLKETVAKAIFQIYKKAQNKNILIELREEIKQGKFKQGKIKQGKIEAQPVYHDQHWLCEAICNLLDNSIKYSPESSCILVILRSNEMFSEICIEDNGIGIDEGEENKIFQIYYRGNRTSSQNGYGMGLFITREIIKQHEGFLKAKRKSKGLGVSIFLPECKIVSE